MKVASAGRFELPSLVLETSVLAVITKHPHWRRGRDSNPREPLDSNGFQDRLVIASSVPLHILVVERGIEPLYSRTLNKLYKEDMRFFHFLIVKLRIPRTLNHEFYHGGGREIRTPASRKT